MEKYVNEQSTDGNVKIVDDVIAKIVTVAASHMDEICYPSRDPMSGVADVTGKLGVKTPARGARVTVEEGEGIIGLFLSIEYGKDILDICNEVREKVKGLVESMTGLFIVEVNVHVVGISAPTSELLVKT